MNRSTLIRLAVSVPEGKAEGPSAVGLKDEEKAPGLLLNLSLPCRCRLRRTWK